MFGEQMELIFVVYFGFKYINNMFLVRKFTIQYTDGYDDHLLVNHNDKDKANVMKTQFWNNILFFGLNIKIKN